MKEKNVSAAPKRTSEKTPQVMETVAKKPYLEPILTRHEQLLENTHFGGGGDVSGIILDP
jgi:hypothetical protein